MENQKEKANKIRLNLPDLKETGSEFSTTNIRKEDKMKKFLIALIAVFIMASALCVTAFAEPFNSNVVVELSGLKEDGTIEGLNSWTEFANGWEAAVDFATDEDFMDEHGYVRIVVDFYADWNANSSGVFGKSSWTGFQYSTIYVPSDVRMTINLNGHTINRGLKEWEYNGEVICINDDADVIINGGKSGDPIIKPDQDPGDVKMGTITGGWSCNGAGGIHMQDGSKLTLNNVIIAGNKADDDDGGGIALYHGAELTMNGGYVSDNSCIGSSLFVYGAGIYVYEASASFKDVTFQNNQGFSRSTHGAAVHVNDGTLSMDGCKVVGNGFAGGTDDDKRRVAYSIIDIINGSKVTINETRFLENGHAQQTHINRNTVKYTNVIRSKASFLTMEKCTFTDNHQVYLIESEATVLNVNQSDFTGNQSFAFYGNCASGFNSAFSECKFSYSEPMLELDDTFFFNIANTGLSFVDCDFGDATFHNKSAAQFVDTDAPNGTGSIFGEGSLTMIIALLAIVLSGVSICLTVVSNKKKTVANKAEKDEEN